MNHSKKQLDFFHCADPAANLDSASEVSGNDCAAVSESSQVTSDARPAPSSLPSVSDRAERPRAVESVSFALSKIGQNLLFGIVSSALLYYYQSVIFLPALAIGFLNVAVQVFNVVKEPITGLLVDKTRTKFGKCRPYLFVAPLLIGIATVGTFINGIYSETNSAGTNASILLVAVVTNLLWNVLYSFGDVPLSALPSVMTGNTHAKSKLLSYAMIAATLGSGAISLFFIPFAQSLTPIFSSAETNEKSVRSAFLLAVVLFVVFATALYQLAGIFSKERVRSAKIAAPTLKKSLKTMFQTRPYRLLFVSELLRSPADTVMTTLTLIAVYYFGDNGNTPYLGYMLALLIPMGVGQVIATLFAPALVKKFERKRLFLVSLFCVSAPTAGFFLMYLVNPHHLADPGAIVAFSALLLAAGAASGVLSVTQSNMIADAVDVAEYETGTRPDGVFFSGFTMLAKISVGVTSMITAAVFAFVGFSGDGVKSVNDALAAGADFSADPAFRAFRFAMFFLMSVPPLIGFFFSSLPIFRYPLSNARHAEIVKILSENAQNIANPAINKDAELKNLIGKTSPGVSVAELVNETGAASETASETDVSNDG